jgi:hypothetical protein
MNDISSVAGGDFTTLINNIAEVKLSVDTISSALDLSVETITGKLDAVD